MFLFRNKNTELACLKRQYAELRSAAKKDQIRISDLLEMVERLEAENQALTIANLDKTTRLTEIEALTHFLPLGAENLASPAGDSK